MVTLKQMHEMIGAYLKVKGDKEVTSIATYNGSSDVDYEIYLADIYNGPIGFNPFSGRDSIKLMKDGSARIPGDDEPAPQTDMEKLDAFTKDVLNPPEDFFTTIRCMVRKYPEETKTAVMWGALSMMERLGRITPEEMKILWADVIIELANQE